MIFEYLLFILFDKFFDDEDFDIFFMFLVRIWFVVMVFVILFMLYVRLYGMIGFVILVFNIRRSVLGDNSLIYYIKSYGI